MAAIAQMNKLRITIDYDCRNNPVRMQFTNGSVQQVTRSTSSCLLPKGRKNYYPSGAPYAEPVAVVNASFQPYKYNGKELDLMEAASFL